MSSTSNTVKTVSRPLDIVLVVDTSGSMENSPHMGTRPESERYRYEEIYAGNLSETEDQEYYTRMEAKLLLKVKNSVLVGIYALGIKWTNGRAEDIRRRFQSKSHPILREKRFGNKYYEAASSAKCSK